MDRHRFNNCVRVLVALQCLELVWSYSILIDTLKNDQQIENSLGALIQSQATQQRFRRQSQDPQSNNTELTGGSDLGTVQGQGQDGSAADPAPPGDVTGAQEPGASSGSADPQASGVQADGATVTSDPTDPNGLHSDSPNVDQPTPEQGQEPSNIQDQPQEGSQSDSGNSDSGNSDSGNSEGEGSDGGNSDSGGSDSGNEEGDGSDSGNSDSGGSDSGNSDSGNAEGGNSDSGHTDPSGPSDKSHGNQQNHTDPSGPSDKSHGNQQNHSDPLGPSDKSHGNQHNPVNMTVEGEQPPRALAMTASDTVKAPIAMAMTGGQGDIKQPFSSSQSDAVSLNHASPKSVGHVHTVPLEANVVHPQPTALPQRQLAPSGTYEPPISGLPMALPQQQANPNAGSANQRPPPNWNNGNQGGGGASPSGGGGVNPAVGPMGGGMFPMVGGGPVPGGMTMQQMNQMNMMRGQYEGIGDQMERQRKMYRMMYGYDPRLVPGFNGTFPKLLNFTGNPYGNMPYNAYRDGGDIMERQRKMYRMMYGYDPRLVPGFNGTFPKMLNFTGNPYGNNPYNAYRYGDFEGYPGYGLDIKTGYQSGFYPPCTNMSDPLCRQRMMAQREIQIETPYGELDIEPGEIDMEGMAAHGLLKQLGLGGPNMNPHMQEINLNRNVQNALKQRFGINTTAGIQRMSSNPEFQAFMYRVLTHSAPVAPGEYNANLTQAEVNWILNDLSASTANHRLTTGNLDHARLNWLNMTSPSGQRLSNTVMTINGGPNQNMANNPWAQMGMGVFPGLPSAQTQGRSQAAAQSGIVQALVQGMLGGQVAATTVGTLTQGGVVGGSAQINGTQMTGASSTGAAAGLIGSNPFPGTVGPNAVSPTGGLPQQSASGNSINTQSGANPTTGQGMLNPSTAPKEAVIIVKDGRLGVPIQNQAGPAATNINGVARESIPIGIQEAGLTNTTLVPPVKALPSGYPSSTVFTIGAISLIVLAILVGPIMCYLCKLKEKREEKIRKQKAIRNRDVSENNIMESMVLHDFGEETASTVTNDAASPYGERYTTLDKDIDVIERFKKTGYLP